MRTVVVGLLWALGASSWAARVLVVFPLPGPSHSTVGHSLVDILLDAGHKVTFVTGFPKTASNPRLKYVDISSVRSEITSSESLNLAELGSNPRPIHAIQQIGPSFTRRGLLHPAMQELLMRTETHFDVVIGEWFYSGLLAPLAAVYQCPFIWYSACDVSWQTLRLVHEAPIASYSVELNSRYLPQVPFTVGQKAYQLWLQIYLSGWIYYMTNNFEVPAYKEIYGPALRVRGRRLPEYEALVHNASLLLINSHPPLGQRLALPQSAKYVGGHHVRLPDKPLPENLQKLLDNAKHGAIFFSMGSHLKSADFPERMKRDLVQLLGQLEQTVLWKFEERLDELPSNVHILDWAPQTSILNHPNTIVFISHGGLLSLIEATHYGVPIVGIPLFGDQFLNVDLAVARGCGLRVDFTENLPLSIKHAVNEMLGNSSYRNNAKQAAKDFQQRLATPQRELAHWVQVVLDSHGAPHLRSPAVLVHVASRLHLDLLMVALMLLWLLSKVLKVVKVHLKSTSDDKKNQ